MIRLWILRHAKSSWDDPGLEDDERPLAPRGRRACVALRRYCADNGVHPALVLCSTARRARETLEGVLPALGKPVVRFDDACYDATTASWLTTLRGLDTPSALIVGHNPALHQLALTLAGGALRAKIEEKLPTGALATFTAEGWRGLAPRTAELTDVVFPRELPRP